MKRFDLEERLIDFAANVILFTDDVVKSYAGNHLLGTNHTIVNFTCIKLWRSSGCRKSQRLCS